MNAKKSGLHSDLEKVDAQSVKPADYDEIPELGDEFFQAANEHHAGVSDRKALC